MNDKNREDQIKRRKIESKLISIKKRMTDSDIDTLQDYLIERGIFKFDAKSESKGKVISEKVDDLLRIIFSSKACDVFLDILEHCGFQDLVRDIENSDVSTSFEEMYSRGRSSIVPQTETTDAASGIATERNMGIATRFSKMESLLERVESKMDETNDKMEAFQEMVVLKMDENNDKMVSCVREIFEKKEKVNKEIEGIEEGKCKVKSKYARLQDTYIGLKKQLEDKQRRLSHLTQRSVEVNNIQQDNLTLKRENTDMLRNQDVMKREFETERETSKDKIEDQKSEIEKLKCQITQIKSDLSETEKKQEELKTALERANTMLKEKRSDYMELDRKYKAALHKLEKQEKEYLKGNRVSLKSKQSNNTKWNKKK